MQTMVIEVRDGARSYAFVEVIERAPRFHAGWESVTYKSKRYQVHGGIREHLFINISHPIKGAANG